jgi:hypothetical protein
MKRAFTIAAAASLALLGATAAQAAWTAATNVDPDTKEESKVVYVLSDKPLELAPPNDGANLARLWVRDSGTGDPEVGMQIELAYEALQVAGYHAVAFPDGSGGWRSIPL